VQNLSISNNFKIQKNKEYEGMTRVYMNPTSMKIISGRKTHFV
jgi:hypothetical protein